jgi:metal-sulfur cluster biosynthetic enzyme/ribosomal protein L22
MWTSAGEHMTLAAGLHIDEPRLRIAERDALTALRAIMGKPAVEARARLRFGPGRTCESLARLLDRAIVQAEGAGLDPALLVVADGSARAAEDIVRVRRTGYGAADWIASPSCRVRIVLRPAGVHATAGADRPEPPEPPEPVPAAPPAGIPAEPADERAAAVRAALCEVIDPDLGVNIVDLGFVRAVAIQGQTAVITMTLTSAACPLTGVMESQIRTALLGCIEDFRVDWQWVPAWRPADITESGREQLHAIGFNPELP